VTKILIADDHALVRDGLRAQLGPLGDSLEIVEARDWSETLACASVHADLELALVDLNMPGRGGVAGLAELMAKAPALPIIVLSATDDVEVMRETLRAGAMGYVSKREPAAVLVGAARLVLGGGMYVPPSVADIGRRPAPDDPAPPIASELTPRQLDVLTLIVEGKSNQEIAEALNMALATVKVHLSAIFRALAVNNRTQAAVVAQRRGLGR
jgi:DNA-binding NarL/FixJ family response regulator